MAVAIPTPIVETKTVAQVQITGFRMNYENLEMVSEYMLLLDDGTPYQRGSASTTDPVEIQGFYDEVEALIRADVNMDMDTATGQVAYAFVLGKLG